MLHRALIASTVLSLAVLGCSNKETENQSSSGSTVNKAENKSKMAVARIEPTKGNTAKGNITLTQMGDKVKVVGEVSGLKANQKHAIHIHEGTECGEDGMKAGGHYNPDKHPHGLPDAKERHAGDWGNLEANDKGVATINITVDNISLGGAKNDVMGRCIIVHEKGDDGSQPTGNAGGRIGCGKIQAALGDRQ